MQDLELTLNVSPISEHLKPLTPSEIAYNNAYKLRQKVLNANKGGRPKTWFLPTSTYRLPDKYAAALIEIAKEWQENEPEYINRDLPF